METIRLQDKHSANKVWIIKRYACGHYYLNQEINGRQFYRKFVRVTRQYLEQLFADGEGFYLAQLVQPEAHFLESVTNHKGKTVRIQFWFDSDAEFFSFIGKRSENVIACHNTVRIGNRALTRSGAWKTIRG